MVNTYVKKDYRSVIKISKITSFFPYIKEKNVGILDKIHYLIDNQQAQGN